MKRFKKFIVENEEQMMLFPMDRAAAAVHDAWMARNPKNDWNANLHVSYDDLPEQEKEKDRQHLETIAGLVSSVGVPHGMKSSEIHDAFRTAIANAFGAIQHEKWRSGFDPEGTGKERIKPVSDGSQVNINVDWTQLHPEWKAENFNAGLAAFDAYQQHIGGLTDHLPTDRDLALQDQWDDISDTYRRGRGR